MGPQWGRALFHVVPRCARTFCAFHRSLAEGPEDARPALAEAMVKHCAGASRVVMYTPFERTRIRDLQKAVPHLAEPGVIARFPPTTYEVIESGERMCLTAAKLGDQGEDRRRVVRSARKPPQDHTCVFA